MSLYRVKYVYEADGSVPPHRYGTSWLQVLKDGYVSFYAEPAGYFRDAASLLSWLEVSLSIPPASVDVSEDSVWY